MTCGIYIITNNITGKQYIGQSIHIEKRMKEHQYCNSLHTSYLENSIQKYGWENFTWNILYKCKPEQLDLEEQKFIALYNTYHNGYNLTRGGDLKGYGNPMHNPILKQKAIEAKKGFKHSKETKINLSKKLNKTGFYRVLKEYDSRCRQGFIYRYEIRKQNIRIRASDIHKLEKKVLKKGHEWYIVNQKLAEKTIKESESKRITTEKEHNTGIAHVIRHKDPSMNQGFIYRYSHWENGKVTYIENKSLLRLKEIVLSKGWEWIEFDSCKLHIPSLDKWLD